MKKTLYVSDLDGTLLGPDSRISQRSREILNDVIARGASFTVATARTPATVSVLLQGLEMRNPAIVMTGAALWDPATGVYSHVSYMNPGIPQRLLEIYRRHDVGTFVYTLDSDVIKIYHQGCLNEEERSFIMERLSTPYKRIEVDLDGDGEVPDIFDKVVLFYTIQPNAPALSVYSETSRMEDVNALCYHDIYGQDLSMLEVFAGESTKAKAIRYLARLIGADRIVAFGDNLNDLPMLEIADVAVAVGNAVEEVKLRADVVIESNDTDAVARFIAEDFARQSQLDADSAEDSSIEAGR